MADLQAADGQLRESAMALVQDERGVRVEDYLTVLAAATGEGALATAGFDVAGHDLPPGSPLFYEPVNLVLTGDVLDDVPAESVYGILDGLSERLPTSKELYELVAGSVGGAEWGHVTVTVDADHRPSTMPLRAAFELRPHVTAIEARHGLALADRATLTATALRSAIEQVGEAIDRSLAVRLALEVTFGMAKLAPMTQAAFEAAAR